jgi:hypothetical protein
VSSWLDELAGLGYRDRDRPIQLALPMAGALDRDAAVAEVVARMGAARSAWNAADVRGRTRGREANTAHLVAADLDDAREQWIAAFGRDRADLGPAAAGEAAARAAAGYRPPRPLSEVLADLRTAWTDQLTAHRHLERLEEHLEHVQAQAAWEAHCQQALAPLETAREAARAALEHADQASTGSAAILTARADLHAAALHQAWDAQLVEAEHAAQTIAAGSGRLGIHRGRVREAAEHLGTWTATWSAGVRRPQRRPARDRGPADRLRLPRRTGRRRPWRARAAACRRRSP